MDYLASTSIYESEEENFYATLLSFGIELEVCLDVQMQDKRTRKNMRRILGNFDRDDFIINITPNLCQRAGRLLARRIRKNLPGIALSSSDEEAAPQGEAVNRWSIFEDVSVMRHYNKESLAEFLRIQFQSVPHPDTPEPELDGYDTFTESVTITTRYDAVAHITREITSPKYFNTDFADFSMTLRTILRALDSKTSRWEPSHLHENDFCGFHVHVGLPLRDCVFASHSIPVFRRLAIVTVVCSEAFAAVRPPSDDRAAMWARPLGKHLRDELSSIQIYNHFMSVYSLEELQELLQVYPMPERHRNDRVVGGYRVFPNPWIPLRNYTLNFAPLYFRADPSHLVPQWQRAYGTVEFRVHSGCVDPDEIEMWTKFCMAMVLRCTEMDDTELYMILKEEASILQPYDPSASAPEGAALDPDPELLRNLHRRRFLEVFIRHPDIVSWFLDEKEIPADEA